MVKENMINEQYWVVNVSFIYLKSESLVTLIYFKLQFFPLIMWLKNKNMTKIYIKMKQIILLLK